MKRILAVVAAALTLAACTTTNTKLAQDMPAKPAAGAKVLVVNPDIELAVLTASGMQEPRADWSTQGRTNIAAAIEGDLKARSHEFKTMNPDEAMSGRVGQLLRLNEIVGASIRAFDYGALKLPTKKTFDWTLGEGTQTLATTYDADYALFVNGRGSYASAGRVTAMVGLAIVGVSVPLGGQTVSASLVDLHTGKVIWFNVAVAGPSDDMRKPEGANQLIHTVLQKLPL
jgi:hypothetical protein